MVSSFCSHGTATPSLTTGSTGPNMFIHAGAMSDSVTLVQRLVHRGVDQLPNSRASRKTTERRTHPLQLASMHAVSATGPSIPAITSPMLIVSGVHA